MVVTNDDQGLANRIADDMADFIWRVREDFAIGDYPGPAEGVSMIRAAVAAAETPVAVGDHSDRNGDATHILAELIAQGVGNTLIATVRDERALAALASQGARAGDHFAMAIGGFADSSSGSPIHIEGTLIHIGDWGRDDHVAAVEFGNHNVVVISPTLVQVTDPYEMQLGPIRVEDFEVFVVKSRVHFRRGFDETGFAKTIVIVEAPGPFVGTTSLDALDYQFAPIEKLYPFGDAKWR